MLGNNGNIINKRALLIKSPNKKVGSLVETHPVLDFFSTFKTTFTIKKVLLLETFWGKKEGLEDKALEFTKKKEACK